MLQATARSTEAPAQRFTVGQFFGSFVFNPRKHPDFGWTWLTKFLVMFGYAGIATFLPYYLVGKFDLSEQEATGVILTATFASVVRHGRSPARSAASCPTGSASAARSSPPPARSWPSASSCSRSRRPSRWSSSAQAIIGLGAGAFFSVDIALATQVLPNKDDTAKDLGVLNIANALPQSLAPAMAPAILAVGAHLPMGQLPHLVPVRRGRRAGRCRARLPDQGCALMTHDYRATPDARPRRRARRGPARRA